MQWNRLTHSSARVGIACAYHESHSWAAATPLDAFEDLWATGDGVLELLAGTQTATGGFLDGLEACGLGAVPLFCARATPSGPLTRDAFAAIAGALAESLAAAGRLDAVLLELHGAMSVNGVDRADARLARCVREAIGDRPLVAVVDPHANLAAELVETVDVLLAYQRNPHEDMADRGRAAVDVLARRLSGAARPELVAARVPVTAAPIAQATADEPLRHLTHRAREAEGREDVWAASILFGYCYGDVPELAMNAVVAADSPATASRLARELAVDCWESRHAFERQLVTATEAVAALSHGDGLTALVDTGDNVGGGAAGDSTALLGPLLGAHGLRSATTVVAADAVRQAQAAGVGASRRFRIGTPAVEVDARVVRLGDGSYVNRGPLVAGVRFDMGPVAVLETGRVTLLVQSRAVQANDQNVFLSAGVDLDDLDAVVLKGAAAVRAGWADRVRRFANVDSPGLTASRVQDLPYERVSRPLWPLDEFEWAP